MEMSNVYDNIIKWGVSIEQLIYLVEDIKGKEYIQNYKLKDIQHIDNIIKKCERCGKYFIPNPNFKKHQKFCDKRCRNQATRDHKYILNLDEKQRQVDLLRKSIYERKYRARRDDSNISMDKYDILLKKLKVLVKSRFDYSKDEYDNMMYEFYKEYNRIVKEDKFNERLQDSNK